MGLEIPINQFDVINSYFHIANQTCLITSGFAISMHSNTCGVSGSCISSQTIKIDYSLYLLDRHLGLDDGHMASSLLLGESDKHTAWYGSLYWWREIDKTSASSTGSPLSKYVHDLLFHRIKENRC